MGLVPFVSLGAATFFAPASLHDLSSQALLAYGATILSFLGGIYWGLAPQLLGWAALLVSGQTGFVLTATGLLALLVSDRAAVNYGLAPAWFMGLRWPLSGAAAASLLLGAFS